MNRAHNDAIAILRSIPDGLVTLDREWRFTYANAPAEQALGRSLADLVGKCVWDEYPYNLGTEVERVLRQTSASQVCGDFRGHDPVHNRWYDSRAFPIPDGGVAIYFRDITDRKRAEEALRLSESRYRDLLDRFPAAVYTCDLEGLLTFFNRRAAELWGREPRLNDQEFRYCGSFRLRTPDGSEICREHSWTAVALRENRPVEGGEMVVERPDGSRRSATAYASPTRDAEGKPTGAVILLLDITDRKQAEDSLRQARDDLEARVRERTAELEQTNGALRDEMRERGRAEEARTELLRRLVTAQEDERCRVARFLHDGVGQSLTSVLVGLRSLGDALDDDVCRDRALALRRVLSGALKEARGLSHGLWPAALDGLGLAAALERLAADCRQSLGTEVFFHAADLEAAGRLPVPVAAALYRIAQEALANTARHAAAGRVNIVAERVSGYVQLIIEDDGQGFAADRIPIGGGTHWGLTSIRERAALLGGEARIESEPGAGTTVQVRIPLAEGDGNDSCPDRR